MTQDWSGLGHLSPEGPLTGTVRAEQTTAVDVIVILTMREHVLLRLHPPAAADGEYWALPSGKPDTDDALAATVRIARAQVSVDLARPDIRHVGAVHGRPPQAPARLGLFFAVEAEPDRHGNPRNADPHRCAQLQWFPLDATPSRLVTYHATGIELYRHGQTFATIGWGP
jgi:ADP-ribose pyrophosphatase YjhB (NUDIX family)